MFLETLLSLSIEAALGLLADSAFADDSRKIINNLTKKDEKERKARFQNAIDRATANVQNNNIKELLNHRPFQEEIAAGLLEKNQRFDFKRLQKNWEQELALEESELVDFFTALQNQLSTDDYWGPVLSHYQNLRFREDVVAEFERRKAPAAAHDLIHNASIHIQGDSTDSVSIIGNKNKVIQKIIFQLAPEAFSSLHRYLKSLLIEIEVGSWFTRATGMVNLSCCPKTSSAIK